MESKELLPSLFRTEYSKIVSVLCRYTGLDRIEAAEDIASETFLAALETWAYKGIPDNPQAWLYKVARNKANNYFHREASYRNKLQHINQDQPEELGLDLSEGNIKDSQLRMLFVVCNPAISVHGQIGLALRLLCGFGIDEIANALLLPKATVNKQLFRARQKLKSLDVEPQMPDENEASKRLGSVLRTMYLLFSEGYYSESQNGIIRKDLCLEAIRLTYLLLESRFGDDRDANALMALMCYHASRLEARTGPSGEIILYSDQDRSLWNMELIERGNYYLLRASENAGMSKFCLEAQIAYWHTVGDDNNQKWDTILQLYDRLLQFEQSPVAALNRIYAFARSKSFGEAIAEAEKINLTKSFFYYILLGELHGKTDPVMAINYYQKALALTRTETGKASVYSKINNLRVDAKKARQ